MAGSDTMDGGPEAGGTAELVPEPVLQTVLVHRGGELPMLALREAAREVFGGHLRPDAQVALCRSGPVRVRSGEGLEGTVRAVHLAVPTGQRSLTSLSDLVLPRHLGFPPEQVQAGWAEFGDQPFEAFARAVSLIAGPAVVLTIDEEQALIAGYTLFSTGRRLWSTVYRPGRSYATWDGEELLVEPLDHGDPLPPEGGPEEFPARGLGLLFRDAVPLSPAAKAGLVPALLLACRPPRAGAEAWSLVEDGRFVPPDRDMHPDALAELEGCLGR